MATNPAADRRYVIIGAGAVGAALAVGLEDAGSPVLLVSRGRTLEAIRAQGLRVRHQDRERVLRVPTVSDADPVALTEHDVLVFTVKSQDAASVLAEWSRRPVVTDEGQRTAGAVLPAVTLQNGLEAERAALRFFSTVVAATTLIAARHVVPGYVDIAGGPAIGKLVLGAYPSTEAAHPDAAEFAAAIAEEFRIANWEVDTTDEILAWKAWKTVRAAAFAVEVLTGEEDELEALRERIRAEALSVFQAANVPIAKSESLRRQGVSQSPARLSTWQSFARGTSSEVDYLAGEVVLTARLHGIPAPINTALQRVLAGAAANAEAPGTRPVTAVLDQLAERAQ